MQDGSAVVIRENIDHFEFAKIETNEIQLAIIQVTAMNQKLNLGALYCSPNYRVQRDDFKYALNKMGDRFLMGGDFNAKHRDWGSRLTLTRGKELRQAIREVGCNFHSTGNPTIGLRI